MKRPRLRLALRQVISLVLRRGLQGWQKKATQTPFAITCLSASVPSLVNQRKQTNGCVTCSRQGVALMLQASIQTSTRAHGLGILKEQSSGSRRCPLQGSAPTQFPTMLSLMLVRRPATFHGRNGGCRNSATPVLQTWSVTHR